MESPYITLTLEVSGTDDNAMQAFHDELRQWLWRWTPKLAYGELRIAYQDQDQINQDAQLEPDTIADDERYERMSGVPTWRA